MSSIKMKRLVVYTHRWGETPNKGGYLNEIEKPDVQLIDVRANDLYSEGHIPGAVNIALESPDFISQIELLDKNNTVAVYCRGGRQSKEAAEKLSAAGFKVVELEGGILKWDGEVSSNVK